MNFFGIFLKIFLDFFKENKSDSNSLHRKKIGSPNGKSTCEEKSKFLHLFLHSVLFDSAHYPQETYGQKQKSNHPAKGIGVKDTLECMETRNSKECKEIDHTKPASPYQSHNHRHYRMPDSTD